MHLVLVHLLSTTPSLHASFLMLCHPCLATMWGLSARCSG
jgi:hypothetical protein